jgi:putative membrane protein
MNPARPHAPPVSPSAPVRAALAALWRGLSPVTRLFLAAWLLAMIMVPIARWTWGDTTIPAAITVATLLQAGAALSMLAGAWGVGRVARVMAVALPLAWAFEYVGHTTGFPFSHYHYTPLLQPQIGGVPAILPFAWMMMLPAAWAVAHAITTRLGISGVRGRLAFIGFSALAMTAWDFFLDPQMVGWNLWQWDGIAPGESTYFGIPWVNFAGWLLASGTITAAASLLFRRESLPVRPLLIIYAVCWALEWGGLILFWGLPGPGIVGFFVMGVPLAAAVWATATTRPESEGAR